MSRKYHTLRLGDDQYRLRLTIRGQNNLRERFQEDTIQTVLGAATDSRRMVALGGQREPCDRWGTVL